MFSGRAIKLSPFWPPGMPTFSKSSLTTRPHLFLRSHKISLVANTVGWFGHVPVTPLVVVLGLNGFGFCCLSWLSFWLAGLGVAVVGAGVGCLWVGNHWSGMPSTLIGNSFFEEEGVGVQACCGKAWEVAILWV